MNKKHIILGIIILVVVLCITGVVLAVSLRKNTDQQRAQNLTQVMIDMAEGRTVNITCYGDSITAGGGSDGLGPSAINYPDHLQDLLRGYYQNNRITVTNCGIGGTNSNELTELWPTSVSKNADLIILMLGTNDAYNQQKKGECNTAQFRKNIDAMMRMAGTTPVLFVNTTPRFKGKYKLLGSTIIEQFRKIVEEKADEYQMPCVDVYQGLMDLYDNRVLSRGLVSQDGSHYQSEGYYHIAEIVFNAGLINEDLSIGIGGYKDASGLWISDYSEDGEMRVIDSLSLSDYVIKNSYMDLYLYVTEAGPSSLAAHFSAETPDGQPQSVTVTNLDIPSCQSNTFKINFSDATEDFVQYDYAVPVCDLKAGLNRVRFETNSAFEISGFSVYAANRALYGQINQDVYLESFINSNGYTLDANAKLESVSNPMLCTAGASANVATLIPNINEPTGYRIHAYVNSTTRIYLGQQSNKRGYQPSYILAFQENSIRFFSVNTDGETFERNTISGDFPQIGKDIVLDIATSGDAFSIWVDGELLYQDNLPLNIGNFVVDNTSGSFDCYINAIAKINGFHNAAAIYTGESWISMSDKAYCFIDVAGETVSLFRP